MNIARIQILGLVACLTLLGVGCTKDPVTPNDPLSANRFTINGDGNTNKKITLPHSKGSYLTSADVTVLAIGDSLAPDSVQAPGTVIFFEGKTTGTFAINGPDSSVIVWVATSTATYALETGSITISKYSAIGGKIEGTFTGTATTDIDGRAASITVTDGAFSALRIADDQIDPNSLNPSSTFSFVINGEGFSQYAIELEQPDVLVDSMTYPGGLVYRRVVATGITTISGVDFIVSVTLEPMQGQWAPGTFPWFVTAGIGYVATQIAIVNIADENDAYSLICRGTGGGSTTIESVEGSTVTGVFGGAMVDILSAKAYTISNGRFSFELP